MAIPFYFVMLTRNRYNNTNDVLYKRLPCTPEKNHHKSRKYANPDQPWCFCWFRKCNAKCEAHERTPLLNRRTSMTDSDHESQHSSDDQTFHAK